MSWTFHQFEDAIAEVKYKGPLLDCDGVLMREVTLTSGERYLIDAALVFSCRTEAEACEARLSQGGNDPFPPFNNRPPA